MKKILLNFILLIILGNVCAQSPNTTDKKKIVYIDIDGKTISKQKFTDKINNGQYSVDISTKNALTYMAITKKTATVNNRKVKAGQRAKMNRKKALV